NCSSVVNRLISKLYSCRLFCNFTQIYTIGADITPIRSKKCQVNVIDCVLGCMFYRNNLFMVFQITILQYAGGISGIYTVIGIEQCYAPKHSFSVLLSEDIVHIPSYDDMSVLLMDPNVGNRRWQSAAYGKLFVI